MKNSRLSAAVVLSSAIGLALAVQAIPSASEAAAMSPAMQQKLSMMLKAHPGADKTVIEHNMARVAKYRLQKCYGINAAYKNDCAAGAHSCAGSASIARDPKSFVLLPTGDCAKIAGGKLAPS